jgi:ubiquinone/menaquinone biosynthesis C-methylase UbiE
MTSAPYDVIADWYDTEVETAPFYQEMVLPGILALVPEITDCVVLDVACGQGLVTRELARRGARVTGVDIAARLLDRAREREAGESLGIEYQLDDAQTLATQPDAAFDGATCCLALMNIPDLAACASAVARVLAPGGWFVATITHPCFQTSASGWTTDAQGRHGRYVSAYFDERYWQSADPTGARGKVGEHHRILSTYVNTFADAGFALDRLHEPPAAGQRATQTPGNLEVPSLLTLRFRLL